MSSSSSTVDSSEFESSSPINLDGLLASARSNLVDESKVDDRHLGSNADIVKLSDEDEDKETPIPQLKSNFNLNTLPSLKPSKRRSVKGKSKPSSDLRSTEMSMVERQTEDALDKATDNMFSRPSIDAGIRPTRRELKESKEATTGGDWFDLPAPPTALLPQWKREAEALQLRNSLDPKRFYKGGSNKKLPKHFAIGRILPSRNAGDSLAEGAEDARSRKYAKGFANELLQDKQSQTYAKRKFGELQSERGQAYGQKKRSQETAKRMSNGRK